MEPVLRVLSSLSFICSSHPIFGKRLLLLGPLCQFPPSKHRDCCARMPSALADSLVASSLRLPALLPNQTRSERTRKCPAPVRGRPRSGSSLSTTDSGKPEPCLPEAHRAQLAFIKVVRVSRDIYRTCRPIGVSDKERKYSFSRHVPCNIWDTVY